MNALFPSMTPEQARLLSPLTLAFVGDSVHTLLTRQELCCPERTPDALHRLATAQVKASAQAESLVRILPLLSSEENEIVRRGRNAHTHHGVPRHASPGDYSQSTALEALYGYLYLTGRYERLRVLNEAGRQKEDLCPKAD